ncbi:hypothetical protein H7E67_04955 [Clostridium gasigenes]|uniref:hypothetical protein n=1 Tax=Clostridium gasigenes TaxID=94869 RepID=UPI0016242F5D|nr:hypothetical protein [Clostridium gasigenes]MBB6622765.1 hypothetical protein [Clostridium gasigenes]
MRKGINGYSVGFYYKSTNAILVEGYGHIKSIMKNRIILKLFITILYNKNQKNPIVL